MKKIVVLVIITSVFCKNVLSEERELIYLKQEDITQKEFPLAYKLYKKSRTKETLQGQIKQGLKLKTEKDQKPLAPKKSQTKGSLASSLEERRKSITGDEDDDNESGIKIDDITSERKSDEKPIKKRPAKETLAKRPPKIKTHSSATGSLLGDIKKGVSLQKTEPQEPKSPKTSQVQKSFMEKVSTYKEKAQEPKKGSDLKEFEQTEQDWK